MVRRFTPNSSLRVRLQSVIIEQDSTQGGSGVKLKIFALLLFASTATGFYVAGPASAQMDLGRSHPFEAVCESQDGTFLVATDFKSLYCNKVGELFTAFTPRQLATQRKLCERVYGAFFGVQGFEQIDPPVTGTGTFCSTAT